MHKSIRRLNGEYHAVLRDAQKRLSGQRVRHDGRLGRVHQVHVNAKGVRIDVKLDDGHIVSDVDALSPCYDP